jgi:NAD(P)H-flavin reductase
MRHSFSVQMNSAGSVSGLVINRKKDRIFIEGELGKIEEIEFVEGKVLTITGENGVLRLDISR